MTSKAATEFDRRAGARIRRLRKARCLSQRALGAALGVSYQQIQKYEQGVDRLRASRLHEIAKYFDVPLSVLVGEDVNAFEERYAVTLLNVRGAEDLLKAFVSIENTDLRRDILALVRTVTRVITHSRVENTLE